MIAIGLLIMCFTSLIFPSIISKTKAIIVGRKGPSLFQNIYDIIRLFKKGAVYSNSTSFIFQIAPLVYFGAVFLVMFFIPFFGQKGFFSFEGDFVFFAYLLALGKFFMIIAAMDTGSGFEGMGANREALYSMLIEPAFFLILGSFALISNHISFYDLYYNLHLDDKLSYLVIIISTYVLGQIVMIENSRMPVDDPNTHLELTMVHEVMVLDNSGFDLALIHLASGLKFTIFGALVANFLIPSTFPILIQILGLLFIETSFAVIVGLLETFRARNKMEKNPQWIITIVASAMVVFLAALLITEKLI